jgi:glycosyltransferase involved in cell wall biosynthesis
MIVVEGMVSTIIPVFNRPELLREAVASVLAQSWRPLEIIIVDDGSTDETPQVAAELARSNPSEIRVICKENAGPGPAREAGRVAARGEFIQHLDSDDLLLPDKFRLQVTGLRESPECGVSYGKTRFTVLGQEPGEIPWKRTGERIETMFPSLLASRWWGTSTPLYRRSVLDAAGPWLSLINEEDWEYDCRIAAQGVRLQQVTRFVSQERDHGGNRLSRGGSRETAKLRSRARAHALILEHAQAAGIGFDLPEMRHFARELFRLCRQCGAAGLAPEAVELFVLARRASGPGGNSRQFLLYNLFTSLLGWRVMGKISVALDRVRS